MIINKRVGSSFKVGGRRDRNHPPSGLFIVFFPVDFYNGRVSKVMNIQGITPPALMTLFSFGKREREREIVVIKNMIKMIKSREIRTPIVVVSWYGLKQTTF